jgi:hypothetical protein
MGSEFEVPEEIQSMLTEEEIENIESRSGWAIGTVQLIRDGDAVETLETAFIELFNGEGRAGTFGGVRFMAAVNEDSSPKSFREAYAYATTEAGQQQGGNEYHVVSEYLDPEDPDYGQPAP